LKEYQAARDFIDSTRKYFSGSKDLTDFYKISSENFLKYYKLLLKYADKPDKISAEMNYKKLSGEEVIADKGWLIKQFEKLI
jgi:hypothetical protein